MKKSALAIGIISMLVSACGSDGASPSGACDGVSCDAWKVCDPATGACELRPNKCDTSADCLSGYTCDTQLHECQSNSECFVNADCKDSAKPVCSNGTCVAEVASGKCGGVSCDSWKVCDPATGACELRSNKCDTNGDCLSGYLCNTQLHECQSGSECFVNADCKDSAKPVCSNGACVAEVAPSKCDGVSCDSWKICDPASGNCELRPNRCEDTKDCLSGYECNVTNHKCELANDCRIDDDCPSGKVCWLSECIDDPAFVSDCTTDVDCWSNKIKRSCVDSKCAVDDCSTDEFACAYNTNGRISCNDQGHCEKPTSVGETVQKVVFEIFSKLKYTKYTNEKYVYDVDNGILFLDCSFWVKQVLRRVSREHYAELPKSSSSGHTALAKDYVSFFEKLADGTATSQRWQSVAHIGQAEPGDVIAYAYGSEHSGDTTGHVMIIMSTPKNSTCSDNLQHWAWITDSARSGHKDDTRNDEGIYAQNYAYTALVGSSGHPSGVGLGKMYFNTGSDPYYRWSSCSGTKESISIKIGRMVQP